MAWSNFIVIAAIVAGVIISLSYIASRVKVVPPVKGGNRLGFI